MAYKTIDDFSVNYANGDDTSATKHISAETGSDRLNLPDESYVQDANISRDGLDLVLETDNGTIIIDNYYAAEPTPSLVSPDGTMLTPDLVNSFAKGSNQYANAGNQASDASPVGAVQEISGEATVTRLDGTVETIGIGTPIYPGDIVETNAEGALNIMFVDETTFAISNDARLAIDEYVFDPATQSGESNFSVLKGMFVFTSGLIGRDDPDDVMIDTPSGSIGIRGTIIAGNVDTGEITVIEGAIVLNDYNGNSITLANQYETARFDPQNDNIEHMGDLSASDVSAKFEGVSHVSGTLFSSINDSAGEQQETQGATSETDKPLSETNDTTSEKELAPEQPIDGTQESAPEQNPGGDPTGEQPLEETKAEPAPQPLKQEIITAEDIVGDTLQNSVNPQQMQQQTQTTSVSSGEQTTPATTQAGPPPQQQLDTPFSIAVTKFNVLENDNGENVARITGNFTPMTNLSLIGTSNNFYEIIREDANNFIVKLLGGTSLDAERPYKLNIQATNDSGAAVIQQNIDLNILNIDEPATYIANNPNISNAQNYFSGTQDTVFVHDFSREFHDPEGNILGYQLLTVPTHVDLASYNFDVTTGVLTLNLDNAVTADGNFGFTVRAITSTGNVDQNFTFDIHGFSTSAPTIFTPNAVYTGGDTGITIAADGVSVFSDNSNISSTINIGGNNAFIKAGEGNDTIITQTSNTGFIAFGDGGHDTFQIQEANGQAFGGIGNDQFLFQNAGTMGALEAAGGTGTTYDGGDGFDTFHLATAGNIDFTNVNNNIIQNIERIAFINGQANNINLSYSDVMNMTDNNNRLRIDMDDNDTLTFTNDGGNTMYKIDNINDGGENYDVFSDGIVTILVDTVGTNTGII